MGKIALVTGSSRGIGRAVARRLAAEEGLFSGISTGANVWAALKVAADLPRDNVVVTVQPDRGDKYLSIFSS